MRAFLPLFLSVVVLTRSVHAAPEADFSKYKQPSEISVTQTGSRLQVRWPLSDGKFGAMTISLNKDTALVESLGIANKADSEPSRILGNVDPVILLTVGSRDLKNPAGWVAFFDNPPLRPNKTYAMKLVKGDAQVSSQGNRVVVSVGETSAGPFTGNFQFTFYPGSSFFRAEAVMSTSEDGRAIIYDAGLASQTPSWKSTAWIDNHDEYHSEPVKPAEAASPLAVRYRTLVAGGDSGSLAVFPAPHQYFQPLDFADNFRFVWRGAGFRKLVLGYGFGIRQPLEGDKRWVPWFNAPPATDQHLAVFYLLSEGDPKTAIESVKRYTHGDTYKPLPGRLTFTSHYHIEHIADLIEARKKQQTDGIPKGQENPGFVQTMKDRGVNILHLAEFHFGDTPKWDTSKRLMELKTLHEECARLSGDEFLLLPGEEPNVHLGGHWISFFPKPVYWVLNRPAGTPFSTQEAGVGTVYHVGDAVDVLQLMEKENGLMWTAHARVKGSRGFPDDYRDQPFFKSPHFFGAAWKAMPADLSRDTLGWRVLDLDSDMANWGFRKHVLGEVDIFRVEPDYETYAPMNINYLELAKLPKFEDGWGSVLDTLRAGHYFVTTGEVLLPGVQIGGVKSGDMLKLAGRDKVALEADVEWTFPLAFAEVVSGDGKKTYRDRISLADTKEFGMRKIQADVSLKGRTWARLEVWDIAANGAFTQPVWIEE